MLKTTLIIAVLVATGSCAGLKKLSDTENVLDAVTDTVTTTTSVSTLTQVDGSKLQPLPGLSNGGNGGNSDNSIPAVTEPEFKPKADAVDATAEPEQKQKADEPVDVSAFDLAAEVDHDSSAQVVDKTEALSKTEAPKAKAASKGGDAADADDKSNSAQKHEAASPMDVEHHGDDSSVARPGDVPSSIDPVATHVVPEVASEEVAASETVVDSQKVLDDKAADAVDSRADAPSKVQSSAALQTHKWKLTSDDVFAAFKGYNLLYIGDSTTRQDAAYVKCFVDRGDDLPKADFLVGKDRECDDLTHESWTRNVERNGEGFSITFAWATSADEVVDLLNNPEGEVKQVFDDPKTKFIAVGGPSYCADKTKPPKASDTGLHSLMAKLKSVHENRRTDNKGGVVVRLAGAQDIDKVFEIGSSAPNPWFESSDKPFDNSVIEEYNTDAFKVLSKDNDIETVDVFTVTKNKDDVRKPAFPTDERGCHYSTYEGRSASGNLVLNGLLGLA